MIAQFVQEHLNDDTARLILDRAKWPQIDIDLAVNCIESRRKLKGKVQQWYDNPDLIFPLKLSAEQCSSAVTGEYKAAFADFIYNHDRSQEDRKLRIADLTGGYGVDSWSFSKVAEKVLYCEMLETLCEAAKHNFSALKADNIYIENIAISPDNFPVGILSEFHPDIIYLDPARRSETGRKVFLIEDCTPDVLTLKDLLFAQCRHILLKLSPMADINMVCERLGEHCREVRVVAMGGECKELLIWMDCEWSGEYSISAVELSNNSETAESFDFTPSEEKSSIVKIASKEEIAEAEYIYEPGKALMKAGAFNTICQRFGLAKLGRSTHYYIIGKGAAIPSLGKTYQILSSFPLDKRSIKTVGQSYPKSEVTARNIPMDTETLRKKLGITSGDDAHIFGLKSDTAGNLLIVTSRI